MSLEIRRYGEPRGLPASSTLRHVDPASPEAEAIAADVEAGIARKNAQKDDLELARERAAGMTSFIIGSQNEAARGKE